MTRTTLEPTFLLQSNTDTLNFNSHWSLTHVKHTPKKSNAKFLTLISLVDNNLLYIKISKIYKLNIFIPFAFQYLFN